MFHFVCLAWTTPNVCVCVVFFFFFLVQMFRETYLVLAAKINRVIEWETNKFYLSFLCVCFSRCRRFDFVCVSICRCICLFSYTICILRKCWVRAQNQFMVRFKSRWLSILEFGSYFNISLLFHFITVNPSSIALKLKPFFSLSTLGSFKPCFKR